VETDLPVGEMPDEVDEIIVNDLAPTPIADKHKSNRNIKYACTECGRNVGRDNLKVKRVVFREMGAHGPVVLSRVVGWLCIVPADDGGMSCLEKDAAWQQPKLSGAPGMADTKLAVAE
jgi:ribosomal protein S14